MKNVLSVRVCATCDTEVYQMKSQMCISGELPNFFSFTGVKQHEARHCRKCNLNVVFVRMIPIGCLSVGAE